MAARVIFVIVYCFNDCVECVECALSTGDVTMAMERWNGCWSVASLILVILTLCIIFDTTTWLTKCKYTVLFVCGAIWALSRTTELARRSGWNSGILLIIWPCCCDSDCGWLILLCCFDWCVAIVVALGETVDKLKKQKNKKFWQIINIENRPKSISAFRRIPL